VKDFKGTHYLGGRFVPKYVITVLRDALVLTFDLARALADKFQLNLPHFPKSKQIINITHGHKN